MDFSQDAFGSGSAVEAVHYVCQITLEEVRVHIEHDGRSAVSEPLVNLLRISWQRAWRGACVAKVVGLDIRHVAAGPCTGRFHVSRILEFRRSAPFVELLLCLASRTRRRALRPHQMCAAVLGRHAQRGRGTRIGGVPC